MTSGTGKAIRFLHENGEKHGDIRRDHIIKEAETGTARWIDFDFNYLHKENMFGYDLFGLGKISSRILRDAETLRFSASGRRRRLP